MAPKGLIHIYCGDGKGKSTAALGLGLRAFGSGKRILLAQFLKDNQSGELNVIRSLGEQYKILEDDPVTEFVFQMTDEKRRQTMTTQQKKLENAIKLSSDGVFDMLILDEIMASLSLEMVKEETLINFLDTKPPLLEVVMTGRDPSPAVLERADYISQIDCIRHPFEKGIPARKGIEF